MLVPTLRAQVHGTKDFKTLALKKMKVKALKYNFFNTSSDTVTIPKEV